MSDAVYAPSMKQLRRLEAAMARTVRLARTFNRPGVPIRVLEADWELITQYPHDAALQGFEKVGTRIQIWVDGKWYVILPPDAPAESTT